MSEKGEHDTLAKWRMACDIGNTIHIAELLSFSPLPSHPEVMFGIGVGTTDHSGSIETSRIEVVEESTL